MSASYPSKVELKQGQVILFVRPGAKRPIWHMRIHVRGMRDLQGNKFTYVQQSTGETDLEEAQRIALNKYDELKQRVRSKEPAVDVAFKDIYALWWTQKREALEQLQKAKGRIGVTKRIGWYEKHAKRYWLAYFGDHKVSELTQAIVSGYWSWRLNYWSKADESERLRYGNHALMPAKKTLDMEQSALREVFAWANAMRIINYQPIIENPFARKGIAAARRPSFEPQQWANFRNHLDKWAKGGDEDRINSSHLYQRKLLRLYVLWIANTGMRPGEVHKLRHRDIVQWRTDDTGTLTLRIQVPHDTKTGARLVVALPAALGVYQALKHLTERTEPDDYIFCNRQGKAVSGFVKTLPSVLEEAGLLVDELGRKRSAYSFRHYYAEDRFRELGYNAMALDTLATNMGTGRMQLEKHYVRKGIAMDEDALVSTTMNDLSGDRANGVTEYETSRLRLAEKARRRGKSG